MPEFTPCQHLDHREIAYPSCELQTLAPHYPGVKYWIRKDQDGNLQRVQFCSKIGRISGILQCYQPGELHCYCPKKEQ